MRTPETPTSQLMGVIWMLSRYNFSLLSINVNLYYNMQAKKSLGQNFLRDKGILKKIADFAQIENGDTVVEVGPGEGGLTKFFLERAQHVIAVEKDKFLAKQLKEKFSEQITDSRLQIVEGDILNYELRIKNYALIGNIPYYITGAVFKKFLEKENPPKSITFVVQKEVAERIMAQPSHKATAGKARDSKESILSISIKAYGKPEFGGIIKAGSFSPKPKVDSAIIAIRNISKEKFANISEQKFFEILRKGFGHKRKLLMKNLGVKKEVFEKCGIPEKARAENLKVEDWIYLAKELMS
jgi:16S rRNA (adenine1518-N6/adenine1519-N6)-dimethyltransferase